MLSLLDNTVLSNFAIVRRPDLIQAALGESSATVEQVMDEFREGLRRGKFAGVDWSWLTVLTLQQSERELYEEFRQRINRGEAACLAVAVVRGGQIYTDDRDAREIAAQTKVAVSGTLGILVRLIDTAHLSVAQADELLGIMIAAGYRSPVTSVIKIL